MSDEHPELLCMSGSETAAQWREGFVESYRRIYALEPFFEDISEDEASETWDRFVGMSGSIVIVATAEDRVVGFGVAVPLARCPDVASMLQGLVPLPHTMYFTLLGVDPAWQGKRLGRAIVKARLERVDRTRYTHVVLAVGEGRTRSQDMYRSLGFHDMGVHMTVSHPRVDGSLRSDAREFMSRVLSQVSV